MSETFDKLITKLFESLETSVFSLKDKVFFYRELSYLIKGGISIVESVNLIKFSTTNGAIKDICDKIYESLKKGENFHRSMTRLPKYFNEGDINIIKSGETSGQLSTVLNYLANEYQFLYEMKNKYIGAMMYPSLVFLVALIAVYIIFTKILPGIISILGQFQGVKIPLSTKILVFVTNFFVNYSNHILIILFFILFGLGLILSVEEGKKWMERQLFNMPLIGKVIRYYNLVKFLRYLKLLISSGMSYIEIFLLLRQIFKTGLYQDMIDDVIDSLRKGASIVDVLRNYPLLIPTDVVVLLKVGEETASLGSSVENAIWLYEEEFNNIINNLSKVLEPLLLVFVGCLVAFISISVFGIIGNILDGVQF